MDGGTIEHSTIATNLVRALEDRLSAPCRAVRGDVKILVAGRVRYPVAVVTCTPIPHGIDIVPEPVVVFEVQSLSTGMVDRIDKNTEYRATPSIQRYVMLEQGSKAATVFERVGDDWVGHLQTGPMLSLPEVGVELPMDDLYANVEFDPPDATETA